MARHYLGYTTALAARLEATQPGIQAGTRPPDYVIELWVCPELVERRQQAAAKRAAGQRRQARTAEPQPDPGLADREPEP